MITLKMVSTEFTLYNNSICEAIGETASRNKVFYGCVVKSNGPADREIKTYIRN